MECRFCRSKMVIRHGKSHWLNRNSQRYRCTECGKTFQGRYRYKASQQDMTRKIDKLTQEGMSVRKIAKKLDISTSTVQRTRKALADRYKKAIEEPYPVPNADLQGGSKLKAPVIYPGDENEVANLFAFRRLS